MTRICPGCGHETTQEKIDHGLAGHYCADRFVPYRVDPETPPTRAEIATAIDRARQAQRRLLQREPGDLFRRKGAA